MNLSLPNFYNFYFKYDWQPADFLAFQIALAEYIGLFSGGNPMVLSGLNPTPAGGLNVNIAPGVCVNSAGYPMFIPTTQTVAVLSPTGGNPAISLIVSRPLITQNNNIPTPTNPAVNVPLNQTQGGQILVLNGTPGATPVAPIPGTGDVGVGELNLGAGISTIASSNFLYDLVNRSNKKSSRVTTITSANSPYQCTGLEDVLECDCTAGNIAVTLAPASGFAGQTTRFMRVDSATGNSLTVASVDLISGQSQISLDDAWSKANIYTNGQSYRMF